MEKAEKERKLEKARAKAAQKAIRKKIAETQQGTPSASSYGYVDVCARASSSERVCAQHAVSHTTRCRARTQFDIGHFRQFFNPAFHTELRSVTGVSHHLSPTTRLHFISLQ